MLTPITLASPIRYILFHDNILQPELSGNKELGVENASCIDLSADSLFVVYAVAAARKPPLHSEPLKEGLGVPNDERDFLIVVALMDPPLSLDVPVVAEVTEASRVKPYLGLTLRLDQKTIPQLLVDSSMPAPIIRSTIVSEVSLPLLNVFLRLIDLLDEPKSIAVLKSADRTGNRIPHFRELTAMGPLQ